MTSTPKRTPHPTNGVVRFFELRLDEASEVLYGEKRRRESAQVINAKRILAEVVPTWLVNGKTQMKLGTSWVSTFLDMSDRDVKQAKRILVDRGVLNCVQRPIKGKSVAVYEMNPAYLVEKNRSITRSGELFHFWCVELGETAGKEQFFQAYINVKAQSKRATAMALMEAAQQLLEEADGE